MWEFFLFCLVFYLKFFLFIYFLHSPCVGEQWGQRCYRKGCWVKINLKNTTHYTAWAYWWASVHRSIRDRILMIVWFNSKRLRPPFRHVHAHILMWFFNFFFSKWWLQISFRFSPQFSLFFFFWSHCFICLERKRK